MPKAAARQFSVWLRRACWGASLALLGGVASGFLTTSSGCVFNDECIVIITPGEDWCLFIVQAQM